MTVIPPESMKAMRWQNSDGQAGVGIYGIDDDGCPKDVIVQVEMTVPEMMELAHDLLTTARDLDPGGAYFARATAPIDLTPEDEKVIRSMLREITDG